MREKLSTLQYKYYRLTIYLTISFLKRTSTLSSILYRTNFFYKREFLIYIVNHIDEYLIKKM